MQAAAVKEEAGGSGRKKMLLTAVAVLLAISIGGGAYVWKAKHHASPKVVAAASPYNLPIPPMMATLDGDSGHASYVRVTAQLQLASEQDADVVRRRLPQVEDLFQTYLHDTRPDELAGSGIYRLREALFAQISNALAPIPVRDLFFTELLVQ